MGTKILKWIGRILLGFVLILLAIFLFAGFSPASVDPKLGDDHGAGASSVEPSYSGLLREFPPLNEPEGNATTELKAELGRLLFFDPVLSENNDISCASCHHPDLGFADGLAHAVGPNGEMLARNTPALWNVGYAQNLFWDGRLDSLEAQASFPLTHPGEMGVTDTDALVAELATIPGYEGSFYNAFDGDLISLEHIEMALAAFQRTLITNNSPFDRYAAGDFDALTASQRRGLGLFRSGATRCFECHTAPTFANDTFRIIGVESDDPGRQGVAADGDFGAFKVPTLRNIVLTAPYMHNGSMATLEEVVDFYADGGGNAHGAENVDIFVQGFELSDQERADIVAFMIALTDDSGLPEIPTEVPSGLPVVTRQENDAWELVWTTNVGSEGNSQEPRDSMVLTVENGETLQEAIDRAQPGDTLEIPYGIYNERVVIDISDFTMVGIPNGEGDFPILDGQGELTEGVIASGNNFTIGNLHVRNYSDNGIIVEGVRNVHFHDIVAEKTGTYGVYPVQSTDVLIERVEVSGADDAGIYAGQCENVIVRDSVVYDNVLGIEVENSVNAEVYNNHAYNNTVGIFIVLLPQLTSKVSANTAVYDNLVENNNHVNFAPGGAAAIAPAGVGILLLSTDNADVYNNRIIDNETTGLALFSLTGTGAWKANEIDVGDQPENNHIHDNFFENNATNPDPFIADLGVPAADIMWDASGSGNMFDDPEASYFPPVLPSSKWPSLVRRSYENILSFLVNQLL